MDKIQFNLYLFLDGNLVAGHVQEYSFMCVFPTMFWIQQAYEMLQVRRMVKIRLRAVVTFKVCQSLKNRQDLGLSEFNLGHFPKPGNLPIPAILAMYEN